MPCEWDGKTIVVSHLFLTLGAAAMLWYGMSCNALWLTQVMEAVRIAPPYTSDSVTGGNPTQLSRVRTLVMFNTGCCCLQTRQVLL
jgi:hypothetical protein